MLIKEFGYHIAYKRWNDTFSEWPWLPHAAPAGRSGLWATAMHALGWGGGHAAA